MIFGVFITNTCGSSAPGEVLPRLLSFVDVANSTGVFLFLMLNQHFIPGTSPTGHNAPSWPDVSGFNLLLFKKGLGLCDRGTF